MQNALTLQWSFGFSKDVPGGALTLCDGTRDALFYSAAQTGVVYDYSARRQKLLQGHCNPISCVVVSLNKKWLITADAGVDSLVVVWDSISGVPIRTIFDPHPKGVSSIDISADDTFLALLSGSKPRIENSLQEISIWEWANSRDAPVLAAQIPSLHQQVSMRFNMSDFRELVTNGESIVYFWTWRTVMSCYAPRISRRNFRQPVGKFTVSTFLPGTTQAVTATSDGSLILWDVPLDNNGVSSIDPNLSSESLTESIIERIAVKVIRLCEGAINYLTTVDMHLVVAGNDGAVRVYDHLFRLEAWFEDLDAGPVTSVSFAGLAQMPNSLAGKGSSPNNEQSRTLQSSLPDFLVGTRSATIIHLNAHLFQAVLPEDRRGTVLVQGMADEVHGIALHPTESLLLIACYSGGLYLWDYNLKTLRMVRLFDASKFRPHCISFDHAGLTLAVGFTSGTVKIIDPTTLSDVGASFKNGKAKILLLKFSYNSKWLTAVDAAHSVALWKRAIGTESSATNISECPSEMSPRTESSSRAPVWVYIGRYFAHTKPVTGLEFGCREGDITVLFSVAEDKKMVEYNLARSTVDSGVSIAGVYSIEEDAIPTACLWHPILFGDFEERIITANSEFKLRQWNADNKLCRRTSLSPTFGGPAISLVTLGAGSSQSDFLAYTAKTKVVGIVKLPLDGNPNKSMGVIAHPGNLSAIAATSCGQWLFTAGGYDQTVNYWCVQRGLVNALESSGGNKMEPYFNLLPIGTEDEIYEKMVDYFYYLQLRRQGEETTTPRRVLGTIYLSDVPRLMRAIGYYPSEQEVVNILSEVKYSTFTTSGKITETVDLPTFICLFVNHRPVSGVKMHQICQALSVICSTMSDGVSLDGGGSERFSWRQIQTILESCGEKFSTQELCACLLALKGNPTASGTVSILEVTQDILGFKGN